MAKDFEIDFVIDTEARKKRSVNPSETATPKLNRMKDRSKSNEKKQKKKKSHKSDKKSRHKSERKAKKEKNEKKREKELKKRLKEEKRTASQKLSEKSKVELPVVEETNHEGDCCGPSIDLMNRAKCPETREQWEHRQSQIRRVVDPETGRIRLIKGDGEILEEMVPRERHKQINQEATKNDGQTFQKNSIGAVASKFK